MPVGHVVTAIAPSLALPSGVTVDLANAEIDYNGSGPVASIGQTDFVVTTQPSANAAESDWLYRSGQDPARPQPGVVFAHDYRSAAEVNRFRWIQGRTGNDTGGGNSPNGTFAGASQLRQITTDGIGANQWCMELVRPPGSADKDAVSWWRPLSPQAGDRGASMLDVRGNPVQLFPNPTEGGSQTANWNFGNYHNAAYDNVGTTKDGNEFWIQWRLKVDPQLSSMAVSGSGKTTYLTRTDHSNTSQEINCQNNTPGPYPIQMYTAGSPPLWGDGGPGTPTQGGNGPGMFTNTVGGPNWPQPYGIWDTFMLHVIPGRQNAGVGNQFPDTGLEMWAAHQGATSWTQIWKRTNYYFSFDTVNSPNLGWNAFIASIYYEGAAFPVQVYHRFAQIIFSKLQIPLPIV